MKKAIGIILILAGLLMFNAPLWLLAADTYTTNYGFIKVDLDSEDFDDPWGAKDHRNWDAADAGIAAMAASTGTFLARVAALGVSTGAIYVDLATEVSDRGITDAAIAASTGTQAARIESVAVSTGTQARRADAFAAFLTTATTRLDSETSKTGAHTAALSTAAYQNGNHSFVSLGVGSMTVTGLVTVGNLAGGHGFFVTDSTITATGNISGRSLIASYALSTDGFISASSYSQYGTRTMAQLLAITPASEGQAYYCSNCSPKKLVISTGTDAGNWAAVDGGTFQ